MPEIMCILSKQPSFCPIIINQFEQSNFMQCEICGGRGANQTIILDGAEMLVCLQCSSYGKPVKPSFNQNFNLRPRMPTEKIEKFDETPLAQDFGNKVKTAREKRGLTVKELAEKLFEKESVLHKIEQQKHPPETRLIEKLEKFLSINLRQKD